MKPKKWRNPPNIVRAVVLGESSGGSALLSWVWTGRNADHFRIETNFGMAGYELYELVSPESVRQTDIDTVGAEGLDLVVRIRAETAANVPLTDWIESNHITIP